MDNGMPVPDVPSKFELDSIPVHARRDGTDDIRGMAKGLPLTRDVSPSHAQVGVMTQGQAVMAAEEALSETQPALDDSTTHTPAPPLVADYPPAPMHVALDQLSDQAFEEEYRRRYMSGRSAMNSSFNQDMCYKQALANDRPARSNSAATTPTCFTPAIPLIQAAGGEGGGSGGDEDDGDDTRGPPSVGSGRGSNPPGPSDPSMMTYPSMAPMRINVIAHEQADLRLTTVNAQSLGTLSANCINALLVEPGFNPGNRISPSMQDQMVRQENRNLLQRSRGDAAIVWWKHAFVGLPEIPV